MAVVRQHFEKCKAQGLSMQAAKETGKNPLRRALPQEVKAQALEMVKRLYREAERQGRI